MIKAFVYSNCGALWHAATLIMDPVVLSSTKLDYKTINYVDEQKILDLEEAASFSTDLCNLSVPQW